MTILTHPGVKTPTLGDIEFTILVEGFLVYQISFSFRCAEVEKKILEKLSNFSIFGPAPWAPVKHES